MKKIPRQYIPINGPRIIYSSVKQKYRFIKFLYHCKFLDNRYHGSIIEQQLLPEDYDTDNKKIDSLFRKQYYLQFF